MKKIAISDLEPHVINKSSDRRGLSEPLETTNIAINHYRLAPNEGFPGGLHTHMDQEEVFITVKGEATFETMSGEVDVGEGEAIRFAPGEFQSGKNDSDTELVAFAIGVPRDTEDVRIPVECPECGHDNIRLDIGENSLVFVCPDCNTEQIPQACPQCGHDNLRITLGEEPQTIAVCQGCGAQFENPPLRD